MTTEIKSTPSVFNPTTETQSVLLIGDTLEQIITMILPAADHNDYGSILETVNFKKEADDLHVVATDGSRLVHGRFGFRGIAADGFTCNVPVKALVQMSKVKQSVRKFGIHISVDAGLFSIDTHGGENIATGPVNSGEYPRYTELFPKEYKETFDIKSDKSAMKYGSHTAVERLVDILKRIKKACYKPETRKDSERHGLVTLCFEKAQNRFETECTITMSDDLFKCEKIVVTDADNCALSDRVRVSFCAQYLIDALDHGRLVEVNFNGELKPVVFKYPGTEITHLLMPIKLR